ncbi:MAG: hypothetical protein JST86_16390 [Bacteroidetes bacterium]|nr:hypothetical protein [Bacteroidota bacterium]
MTLFRFDDAQDSANAVLSTVSKKAPFVSIHGNVLYSFSYRSYIDTPFAQNDLVQQLVQTRFDILLDQKYPLRVTVSGRSSNSPYFKDAADVNVEFNRQQMIGLIRADLNKKIPGMITRNQLLADEKLCAVKLAEVKQLQSWLTSPARLQEQVEERERLLRGTVSQEPMKSYNNQLVSNDGSTALDKWFSGEHKNMPGAGLSFFPSANTFSDTQHPGAMLKDSLAATEAKQTKNQDTTVLQQMNSKRKELAELIRDLKQQEAKVNSDKKNIQDSVAKLKQQINALKSGDEVYALMKQYGMSRDSLTKWQKILLSVNKIGIGRSWVDYSDLTVKNISLTGVNAELTPGSFYVAIAAGKLNYRYRDFILKDNISTAHQSLFLVRAGIGKKEKNNLIFTFYSGRKQLNNYTLFGNGTEVQPILGFAAETRLSVDANNYIIAEVAKSSYVNASYNPSDTSSLLSKATNWKTRSNEAYTIKLFSYYPQTNTRITAWYRKMGELFQSFSLYPANTNQEAWMARVNQSLWKKRVVLDGAVRKNDFQSPVALPSYSGSTIFKSLQATVRFPRYPFISVGYYPTSQLSLANNNVLAESQYNTLNALMGYSYGKRRVFMSTNAVYTRFYNSSADTAFLYYNAVSLSLNQSFTWSRFIVQSTASISDQRGLHLFTAEQMLGYEIKNAISVRGSLKWNRLNSNENLFGAMGAVSIYVKKLGSFQLNYDKTYLPSYDRQLKAVDMGRMTFYREF